MTKNKMNFSGSFYPNEKSKLLNFFKNDIKRENLGFSIKALISPHAGYIYSAEVANIAYNYSKDISSKRVIVIGPLHRYYLEGASISLFDSYETPLGDLKIDLEYANYLKEKYDFLSFDEEAHFEHSTETQIPFIKNYFDTKVIEITYGKINHEILADLILDLLLDDDNLLVISTDLSHFHTLAKAKQIDNNSINSIMNFDIKSLERGCEACGMTGVKALLKASKTLNFKINFCAYKTSFDITKDDSSVVGYSSFVLGK